jgi:hypothetical protein
MNILYQVDDGILFVNPHGSIRKGPYIPVGRLSEKLQANLERIIQEVENESQAKENEKEQRTKKKEK